MARARPAFVWEATMRGLAVMAVLFLMLALALCGRPAAPDAGTPLHLQVHPERYKRG